jgi:RNA polymerase sigma factor (sigma-70 family)
MNRHLLQIVLRQTDVLTADADPHLLRRYVASRDEAAFAALVKRHGPMVWAVCRQSVPNHADAEDAFQATFLALAQSAKGIRTPERLAGWLHAAAVRIAAKAKRSFTRRVRHEHTSARPESDSPVSAAAWGDLQAAVHAEVSGLPPSLRAVFVLCDLEGVDHAEAARRLGLKAGTLSGQLARARQRLLAALSKRGIAAGAVALGAAVSVPEVLANKVTGGAVPSAAVMALATEVTTVGVNKLKLLAAGLLVAGGLTLSGLGLLSKADGQAPRGGLPGAQPPGGFPGGSPGAGGAGAGVPGGLPGGLGGGPLGPGPGGSPDGGEGGGFGEGVGAPRVPPAGDYLFVGKPNTVADVAKLLKDKSAKGWEYTGPLDVDPATPPTGSEFEGIAKDTRVVLVFKKKPAPMGGMSMGGMGGSGMGMPGGGSTGGPLGLGGGSGLGGGRSGGGDRGGGATQPGAGSIDGRPNVPGTGKGTAPGPGASGAGGGTSRSAPGGDPLSRPGSGAGGSDAGRDSNSPLGGEGEAAERFDVLKLKNAYAEETVKLLHEVFNGPGKGPGRVRLVADTRTNSIVVVKASATDMEILQKLLAKSIDVEGKPEKK